MRGLVPTSRSRLSTGTVGPPEMSCCAAGAHAIALLGVKRDDSARLGIHTGFWPFQIFVWAVLIFVAFLIPNSVFSAYGQASKASAVRMLKQKHSFWGVS